MVDVVGLRFVTEGEQNALRALEQYRAGLRDTSRLQDQHVNAMNRAVGQEINGLINLMRMRQRAVAEQERAFQQEIRAFENAQQIKKRTLEQEAAAQQRALQASQEWAASLNERLGVTGQRATELGATFSRLDEVQQNLDATARAWTAGLDERLGVTGQRATEAGAGFAALDAHMQQVQRAYDHLRGSIDPTHAASIKLAQAQRTVAAAIRQGVVSADEGAQTMREYAAALNNTSKANEILQQETQRLARAYNPAMAAANAFEREQEQLNRAMQLGVLSADAYQAKLAQLQTDYNNIGDNAGRAARFMTQYGQVVHLAGMKTNRFGMYAQQVGYQVGDFFVQIQSGTNAFVAFGQQATQLAGLLPGLAGAVLGIGISVTTMFLSMWSRTQEATNTAEAGLQRYAEALKSLRDQTISTRDELTALFAGFEGSEEGAIIRQIALMERELRALPEQYRAEQQRVREEAAATSSVPLRELNAEEIAAENAEIERRVRLKAQEIASAREELEARRQIREEMARATAVGNAIRDREQENAILEQQINLMRQGVDETEARRRAEYLILLHQAEIIANADGATEKQRMFAARLAESERYSQSLKARMEAVRAETDAAAAAAQRLTDALAAAAGVSANLDTSIIGLRAQLDAARAGADQYAQSAARELAIQADGLRDALRSSDPLIAVAAQEQLDRINARLTTYAQLQRDIAAENTRGGGAAGGGTAAELANLQSITAEMITRIERERVLLGLQGQARLEQEIYYDLIDRLQQLEIPYRDEVVRARAAEIAAMQQVNEELRRQQQMQEQVANTLTNLFLAATRGADAFKQALAGVLAQLAQMLANRAFTSLLSGSGFGGSNGLFGPGSFLSLLFGMGTPAVKAANGMAFSGGNVIPFAKGGVVDTPTMFPMAGKQSGLMGEAGPEAIMPLKRGRDGKLGVASSGQSVAVDVRVRVDEDGNWRANVERIADNRVRVAAPRIVGQSVAATYATSTERRLR